MATSLPLASVVDAIESGTVMLEVARKLVENTRCRASYKEIAVNKTVNVSAQ